jgi:Flp pilus assembly protein TadB
VNLDALSIGFVAGAITLPRQAHRSPRQPSSDGQAAPIQSELQRSVVVLLGLLIVVVWHGPAAVAVAASLAMVARRELRRWQNRAADRRMADDIPNVLHDVARRLRAGYSAPLAFAEVLGRLPVAHPGHGSAAALARGDSLRAAVTVWRDQVHAKVGATVLDELVAVVALGEALGGVRASAIEVLADLATERSALAQEVGAQASQAKASAVVMTVAPLVFSAQMVLRDPAASRLLLGTPIGWVLMAIGGSLDGLAWLWIQRLASGRRPGARGRRPRVLIASPVLLAFGRRVVFGRATAASRLPSPVTPSLIATNAFGLESIGRIVERATERFTLSAGLSSASGPSSPERRRRLGLGALLLPPLLIMRPVLGAFAVLVLVIGPRLHRRSIQRAAAKQRAAEVGSVIELVRLALEGGSTPSLALIAVEPLSGRALRPSLTRAADDLRRGVSLDVVLRRLTDEAPELRALSDVLLASSRFGLGVAETLRSLAVEARAARRRQAEAAARRLPVALLFPVVCLTLPAFVVLTVAPLLLSGLGALHF